MRSVKRIGGFLLSTVSVLLFLSASVHAQSDGVVFWNKMENYNGADNSLVSEIGPDLNLAGADWSFRSAMFNDGWDNNSEGSYAYVNTTDVVASSREGALAFWWVPDDAGDEIRGGKASFFFSNGATNYPANDRYGFDLSYSHGSDPPTVSVFFWKKSASGVIHAIHTSAYVPHPYTGDWEAGDRVHVALAWHNEPVILGQYIVAVFVDGELALGWEQPDGGTAEGWRTTNPSQPFSAITRIGDAIFSYSADEQLKGPIDNVAFWDYAKSDFSDRFTENPRTLGIPIDVKPFSSANRINPNSPIPFPVAILGSELVDVRDVDVTTLLFGPDGAAPALDLTNPLLYWLALQDVNDDGETDLLATFLYSETGLPLGESEACLTGEIDGIPFQGCDTVLVAPPPGCGLSVELALLLPPLMWLFRKGRRRV